MWKSKEDLQALRKIGRVFTPRSHVKAQYQAIFTKWQDAVQRMSDWYSNNVETNSDSVVDVNPDPVQAVNSFKVKSNGNRKKSNNSK